MAALDQVTTLHELVLLARRRLAKGAWDYLQGGAETETGLARNRLAIERLALRPRVCVDVREVDASSELFGRRIRLPVFLAPIGSLETFHPTGGAGAAEAAARFGVPLMLSGVCAPGLEAVARAAPEALRIFQLYVRGDEGWIAEIVARAEVHGYAAFAITVDTAWYSRRERDLLNRFEKPWRREVGGQDFQKGFDWRAVARFKARHRIPLILKGIMTAEDARIALDHGVDGVLVSNHGGRQLDHVQGTLDVLPEIVEAVAGRALVLVDGGFCRGTDILKAIALGAKAVGLGRMLAVGMAAGGPEGVVTMLELLEEEIRIALGLLGVTRLAELGRSHLARAEAVRPPGFWSAFPLVAEGY
ncbi:MAG: alpha-hydroxy-acid oxidizing protein [Geminicoccaceae bacterium]|nr:alpha-hydroxy-acid oxidizing protein [Geminicoccaceae bacterium]MCX8101562.1 alpha-hydroxy-acid oxidizing protein [Geminicoccaceae bacterium]MDW8369127.1 alpha-hydroxy acid oxidase [Geminicoccaceae bacterium]